MHEGGSTISNPQGSLSKPACWNSWSILVWSPLFHLFTSSFGTLKEPSHFGFIMRPTLFLRLDIDKQVDNEAGDLSTPVSATLGTLQGGTSKDKARRGGGVWIGPEEPPYGSSFRGWGKTIIHISWRTYACSLKWRIPEPNVSKTKIV